MNIIKTNSQQIPTWIYSQSLTSGMMGLEIFFLTFVSGSFMDPAKLNYDCNHYENPHRNWNKTKFLAHECIGNNVDNTYRGNCSKKKIFAWLCAK